MYDITERLDKIERLTLLAAKKRALTLSDIVLLTGLSSSHIYKLCANKSIPYYKAEIGGKISYFDRDEIEDWLLHRRIKTNTEVEAEAANYTVTGKFRPAASRADVPATLNTVKGKGNGHKKTSVS